MSGLTERTQVLLTHEQRARLEREAADRKMSVGALIREAVDAHVAPRRRSRAEALADLLSADAPVADWEQMEEEIMRGMLAD